MTTERLPSYVVAAILLALATAGFFHLFNPDRQEVDRQALTSLDQGIALFREKKYSESLETLQGIPEGAIENWRLPYYTASSMVMLKDYESAVFELEEALALNPQETLILFELGVVHFKLGNLALSKGYFATVVEIEPTNEDARGLMDVMAKLERQQSAQNEGVQASSSESEDTSH